MNVNVSSFAHPLPSSPDNPAKKLLYSRKEAAAMLSISVRMIDYWISRKVLSPIRRIGGRVLIPVQVLHEFARRDHVVVQ